MPSLSDLQRQQLIELSKTDFENLHFIDENSLECAESLDLDNLDVLGLIRLNISGTRFEVLRATLLNQRYIYDKLLHDGIYRAAQQEYYFDRDPAIFKIVLWYCRYGELHVPHHYCGPLLERELALWGIQSVIEIQNCCVSHLMDTKSRLVSLKKFENFFKEEMESEPLLLPNSVELEEHLSKDLSKAHGWRKRIKEALIALRKRCWKILDHPSSSFPAAVYAVILSVTVLYTVFSFVASTSERFQRPMTPGEVAFYSAKHPAWYGNRTDASAKIKVDWLTFPDWIAFGTLTFDFCVRFICCKNKLAYFKNNYTIIDFLSILPFYINELLKFFCGIVEFSDSSYFGPAEYIAFLKITLFMRLLRIGRHYRGLQVLIYTLRTSFRDLMLMGVFVALGTLLFSTLIFFCEKSDSQTAAGGGAAGGASGATDCSKCNRQGTDSRFTSMFDGFWWSLVTMTTVGYGDLVPQTWPEPVAMRTLAHFQRHCHTTGERHYCPFRRLPLSRHTSAEQCRHLCVSDIYWTHLTYFVYHLTIGVGTTSTITGRIVGSACALSGLLLIAFTVPILVNHFMLYYSHSQIVHVSKSSVQEYATKALLAKVNSFAGGKVKRMRK
uniref:BTB domain-containing protein n=1 Tax=Macrostomum lignano TaxID=282301 RepID=A0A1I8GSR2_9PLAT